MVKSGIMPLRDCTGTHPREGCNSSSLFILCARACVHECSCVRKGVIIGSMEDVCIRTRACSGRGMLIVGSVTYGSVTYLLPLRPALVSGL